MTTYEKRERAYCARRARTFFTLAEIKAANWPIVAALHSRVPGYTADRHLVFDLWAPLLPWSGFPRACPDLFEVGRN